MTPDETVPIFDEALAARLLSVEFCILAQDDENVVVAIRVPKATIRANMAFLTALADLT